jgi:hypothetical protein
VRFQLPFVRQRVPLFPFQIIEQENTVPSINPAVADVVVRAR